MLNTGVPGTGKTATVKQVMRYLDENKDEYPEFDFFELNGMRLTCPEQIYVEMWKHLSGGEKLSAEASLKRLDERFAKVIFLANITSYFYSLKKKISSKCIFFS